MKLKYNVLCVDDDIETLDSTKEKFEEFNSDVGIEVEYQDIEVSIKAREKPDIFQKRILKELSNKFKKSTFDLILVDLHMREFTGEHIISSIRNKHTFYRPIIFYSAGDPPAASRAMEQLTKAATDAGILGKSIFITTRKKLHRLLKDIATEMHIEEQKVNHVRGLLMDQVSELDANVINAIKKKSLWNDVPKDKRKKVAKEFKDRIGHQHKIIDTLFNTVKEMEYGEIKDHILKNPDAIDTFSKSKILREILRHIVSLKKYGKILSEGINSGNKCIIDIRNAYGHQTAESLKVEHTPKKCKLIREETRRQVKNIKEVIGT